MIKHYKKYEQYCHVKGKNIIMEETVFHNGDRSVVCTELKECTKQGGCRNKGLKKLWTDKKSE